MIANGEIDRYSEENIRPPPVIGSQELAEIIAEDWITVCLKQNRSLTNALTSLLNPGGFQISYALNILYTSEPTAADIKKGIVPERLLYGRTFKTDPSEVRIALVEQLSTYIYCQHQSYKRSY